MKLSKTQTKTIIAVFVALIFLGVYSSFFVIIKNKNNQISTLQNQVDIEVRKDQQLYSIKQLTDNLRKEFEQIDAHFVPVGGVVDFLENLEALGSIADISVHVNSVNVKEDVNNEFPYELLKIEFVARGEWRSVVQLISLLETLSLGITIERMQLERLPDSSVWQINTSFIALKLK